MFQFPGFAPCLARCRNCLRRVAPFGNPRINGYLPLPAAYRSLSRPSSPPRAKASFMCLFLLSVFPLRKVAFLFVSLVRSLHTSLAASLPCLAAEPRGNGYFLKVCASLVRLLFELVFYFCVTKICSFALHLPLCFFKWAERYLRLPSCQCPLFQCSPWQS